MKSDPPALSTGPTCHADFLTTEKDESGVFSNQPSPQSLEIQHSLNELIARPF
jgi:hypothetical protein